MGTCSRCCHWHGGQRNRGECDRRQHLAVGSATDAGFGGSCDQYERHDRRPAPRETKPNPTRPETMLELRARLRREARRAERRRVLSRSAILAHTQRLSLRDVQWLRGELARVAGEMVRRGGQ